MINRNMMRQAQELQARLAKAQQDLAAATVEGSSGGGAVKVIATGQQEIKEIKISPEAINPEDAPMLEDLVLTAVNEALNKSRELTSRPWARSPAVLKYPA